MQAFEFASPTRVADAVKLLAGRDGSAALAGGTDLIDRMKDYVTSPTLVVSLRAIKELAGINAAADGGLAIGAKTRLVDIVENPGIGKSYPAIRQAAIEVGSPQIRNMATLGGNLLQRPRCWYFRNGFGLLGQKEGTDKNLMRDGDNRYGAIFMTDSDALFVNTSSLAPALIALGAKCTISGTGGDRVVDVASLYRTPKSADEHELALQEGDVLTLVNVPSMPNAKNATYEVRLKQSHDWPLVLCSVCLEMSGDKVSKAKVVLGSVAPVPLVCEPAAQAITGKAVTPETAEAAGKAAVASAKPLSMNAYKVKLTEVAVKRALLSAVGNRYWEA